MLHSVFPRERDESLPPPEIQVTLRRVSHPDNNVDSCHLSLNGEGHSLNQLSTFRSLLPSSTLHGHDHPTMGHPEETQTSIQGESIQPCTSHVKTDHEAQKET